jgi:hypothetical protein
LFLPVAYVCHLVSCKIWDGEIKAGGGIVWIRAP